MNKILGVIFLSLLLSGCAPGVSTKVQTELINQNKISVGMTYSEIKPLIEEHQVIRSTLDGSNQFLTLGDRVWETFTTFFFRGNIILLEQPDKSKQTGFMKNTVNNYKVIKIYTSENHIEFYDYILQLPNLSSKDINDYSIAKSIENMKIVARKNASILKAEKQKAKTEKTKNELVDMINSAKSTCKTLGFEEGTDKFTDCSLKLYSQEVENKVAIEVAKQKTTSSSSSGTMTIYDPVRDRQNQIDRGMKMLSGGCTLGIDC